MSVPVQAPASAPCLQQDGHTVKWLLLMLGLILFSAVVIALLTILTTYARQSTILRHMITVISSLSIPIITYTVIVTDDPKSTSPLFILSAIFLHLTYKKISLVKVAFRKYDEEDLEEINKIPTRHITGLGWIAFLLVTSNNNIPCRLKIPTCVVLGLSMLKVILRYWSFRRARQSFALGRNAKVVASYMEQYLALMCERPDPEVKYSEAPLEFMSEYKYMVMGEERQKIEACKENGYRITLNNEWGLITLDKVWACEGEHLRGNEKNREVCLSFALFKLLRTKFEGHQLPESHKKRALRLVLDGPFKDHNCAFRIIETELTFLHDYLCSTLPFTYYRWILFFNILLLLLLFLCCVILIIAILYSVATDSSFIHIYYQSMAKEQTVRNVRPIQYLDASVCLTVIIVPLFMETWEIITYLFSDWAKVVLLCMHVKYPHKSSVLKALNFLCYWQKIFQIRPWSNKLNQHSLLRKIEKRTIDVPEEVKEAVIRSLKDSGGRLTNGTVTLDSNGVRDPKFSEACRLESHTERILVWHIATSHCEAQRTELSSANRTVASCLSRYCYYLVKRVPDLIPDESEWTRFIVQQVINQIHPLRCQCTRKFFHIRGQPCDFCRCCTRLDQQGQDLVSMGKELGAKLVREITDESQRWKVLADLWAEMILYMAPSDNLEAHKKSLGYGGQFITHIWALLYHTGVNNHHQPELLE